MAEVTVFVDDAVLGRLPGICAKEGVMCNGRLRIIEEIGTSTRLGILWLLLLAGPPGWIALVILAGRGSREELAIAVPYSDVAYQRVVAARRHKNTALLIAILGGLGLFVLTISADLGTGGFVLALGALLLAGAVLAFAEFSLARAVVSVRLDASRRWVTLGGVHPAFATACKSQRGSERATPGYSTQ